MSLLDAKLAKWEKVEYSKLISKRELEEVYNPQVLIEDSIDYLMITLKGFVLTAATGEPEIIRQSKIVYTKVVATWWDHFKLNYSNRWWMPFKKVNWKVLEQKVTLRVVIEPRVMFPHAKVNFPQNFGKPVIYYEKSID